jgi:hypothetical protein
MVSSPASSVIVDEPPILPAPCASNAPAGDVAELERLEEVARSLAEGIASLRSGDDRLRLARALVLNVIDVLDEVAVR